MLVKKVLKQRYEIIRAIGSGAFGTTYIAIDRDFPGQPYRVVKHLCPLNEDPQALEIAQRLFETEAEVLSRLGEHDRIPRLFSYFDEDDEFYLVQELIEGKNLVREFQPGRRWNENRIIEFLQELLEVLSVVHQQEKVHRDLKPANIMRRDRDGSLVLIDFGAVKELLNVDKNNNLKNDRSVIIGTPGYMAPEQLNGLPKECSDVYSVGKLAIQALTGLTSDKLPFSPEDLRNFLHKNKINISPNLESWLCKAIAIDTTERYDDAAEALQALPNDEEPVPITAKPKLFQRLLIGIAGAIAITTGLGLMALNSNAKPDYTQLETYLTSTSDEKWEQADIETQRLLLKIANETSALDAESIAEFPCEPLMKIDELWRINSDGRFGFTPQTKAFLATGNEFGDYTPSTYKAFKEQIKWIRMRGAENNYGDLIFTKIAPPGHLPSPGRMAANKNDLRIREREMLLTRFNSCGL